MSLAPASFGLATPLELSTARLRLRLPAARDFEAFATFYATERTRYMGGPLGRADAWRAFGHIAGHWMLRGWGSFVIVPREAAEDAPGIGAVGPWFPEGWPERELGWSLWSSEAEGSGYVAEALREAILPFARDTLGFRTAVSYIAPQNAASIAVAERVGARHDPEAAKPPKYPDDLVYRHDLSGRAAP